MNVYRAGAGEEVYILGMRFDAIYNIHGSVWGRGGSLYPAFLVLSIETIYIMSELIPYD